MKYLKIFLSVVLLGILSFNPITAKAEVSFLDFLKDRRIGKAAPDFTLQTTSGQEMNMTKFRNGDNAIIFFWATWCPHCQVALSKLNQEQGNIAKKGIKIILVDLEENAQEVRSHLKRGKIDLNVFLDQEGSLSEPYGIIGVPTFYFVDKDGIVQAVEHSLPKNYEEYFLKSKPKT